MSDASHSPVPPDGADETRQQPNPPHTTADARPHDELLTETNPEKQPGIPDDPVGPAEGGD